MVINNHPQYFAVFNDETPEWKQYIKWLVETYKYSYEGTDRNSYYGYDGGKNWNGTFVISSEDYINTGVIVFESASEFIELLGIKITPQIHEVW